MLAKIMDATSVGGELLTAEGDRFSYEASAVAGDGQAPCVGDVVTFTGTGPGASGARWAQIRDIRVIPPNDGTPILSEVAEWKREAKLEETGRYFYLTREAASVGAGDRCFVIGRKGTGKTAIAEYLLARTGYNQFSTKLSFTSFPFNELYAAKNSSYTAPNHYITLWKYVLYSTVAQLMLRNEQLDSQIRSALEPIYGRSLKRSLATNITEWMGGELSLSFAGIGGKIRTNSASRPNEASWIERTDVLEQYLVDNLDDSEYVIVFDELDEDYSHLTGVELDTYMALLTGLFKAVQDVMCVFGRGPYKVRPVVLLRDDIYARLRDSDKSKWEDLAVRLEWTDPELRAMLGFRLARAADPLAEPSAFDEAWASIFCPDPFDYHGKSTSIYEYITRCGLFRPRDYVVALRECAQQALNASQAHIDGAAVLGAQPRISRYMFDEFKDELGGPFPEIPQLFEVLQSMGKAEFTFTEFSDTYARVVEKYSIIARSPQEVAQVLFDHSVIGCRVRSGRGDGAISFRFEDPCAVFRPDAMLVVHVGLIRALAVA